MQGLAKYLTKVSLHEIKQIRRALSSCSTMDEPLIYASNTMKGKKVTPSELQYKLQAFNYFIHKTITIKCKTCIPTSKEANLTFKTVLISYEEQYILVVKFLSPLGIPFKHLPVFWSSKHITMFSSNKKYEKHTN